MFSGMVRARGRVLSLARYRKTWRLRVRLVSGRLPKQRLGDSVAVSGACLTVVSSRGKIFEFDLLPETLKKTHFRRLKAGDAVNLEPPVRYGDRLHGHEVLGHVEGTARLAAVAKRGRTADWKVSFPRRLHRAIVPKGSVALEGVSLTVGRVLETSFEVHLISHTLQTTNLGAKKKGDPLNIETDVLLRRRSH